MSSLKTIVLSRRNTYTEGMATISFAKGGVSCISRAMLSKLGVTEGDSVAFADDGKGNYHIFKSRKGAKGSYLLRRNGRGTIYFCSRDIARAIGGVTAKTGPKSKTIRMEAEGDFVKHEGTNAFKLTKL